MVRGRSIYFGSDPDEALARYQLYQETGLLWKRGYRQFCLEKDGEVTPLGATMEIARRNFAALQDRETRSKATPRPDEFALSTVKEVGDAYVYWLTQNKKNPTSISQVTADFKQLIDLPECGNVRLEDLTLRFFNATWLCSGSPGALPSLFYASRFANHHQYDHRIQRLRYRPVDLGNPDRAVQLCVRQHRIRLRRSA